MSDLLATYVADLRLRGQSRTTIVKKADLTSAWLKWCRAHDISPEGAEKDSFLLYLQDCRERGLKTASLHKLFSNLASFYEFLDEDGQAVRGIKNIQKKYLKAYKPDNESRQNISISEAMSMVAATLSTRDQAILIVLLKTGIRRAELTSLDVDDVDLQKMTIRLKPTGKRSNRLVFIDDETAEALRRWLKVRRSNGTPALFTSSRQLRISGDAVRYLVVNAAARVGLHNSDAPLDGRFGAHCCRHWFTTHLLRAGMRREYVQWLRGDAIREAVDIYYHIDPEDVRRAYLAHIPQLGI